MTIQEIEAKATSLNEQYRKDLQIVSIDSKGQLAPLPSFPYISIHPREMLWEEVRKSFVRDYVICSICSKSVKLCEHKPITPEKSIQLTIEQAAAAEGNDPFVPAGKGKRGPKRTFNEMTEHIYHTAKKEVQAGAGAVDTALKHKIAYPPFSNRLKEDGVVVKRGRKKKV